MRLFIATALLAGLFATPALAASYPVQGRWGESTSLDKEPIDCAGRHVIAFRGERRFDSRGGVPDLRAIAVEARSDDSYRIVEEFRTGQINARNRLTLRVMTDPDRIALAPQRGPTLTLRKCK